MTIEPPRPENLIAHITREGTITLESDQEGMWLDVIAKIDEVYSDLIRYETDLEAKNTELEEAQAFISSVLASVSDVLVVVDERGVILQVNPALERLVGQDEATLIGAPIYHVVEDSDHAALRRALGSGCGVRDCELRFATGDGPSDLMAINTATRVDHHGHRVGAVLTARPIGELRRAYEALHKAHLELQQAQRKLIEQEKMASIGRLVAGVAHELNNPISFVYGNIHTLERYRGALDGYLAALHAGASPAEMERLRQALKVEPILADLKPLIEGTLEGAVRISEIVRNLRRLSFSRSGDQQVIDLGASIRTAAQWAQRAKNSRAQVTLDLEPECRAQGQEGQIHQVLVNLIDNALDAVADAADPRIRIRLHCTAGEAVIEVCDNGRGIAEAIADKIFEPFFTTKTVGEGTGLGLWISYSIAKDHGGTLSFAACPTGGALFTLRLPAAKAHMAG